MSRRFLTLLLLLAGCGATKEQKQDEEPKPHRPPPLESELPPGTLHRTSRPAAFGELLDALAPADLVCVGEKPGYAAHHELELKVVEYLADRGRLDAIGMEMFERDAQAALDDYVVAHRIDEEAFLARTRFEERWGFEFAPYRPILVFAREQRIPVIALGVPRGVRTRIAQSGLAALTAEERAVLPALDPQDRAQRAYVEGRGLRATDTGGLDRLWDEAMADAVVRWFRGAPPDAQIVVLAAAPRLAGAFGIPARVRRRTGKEPQTLLPVGKNAPEAVFAGGYAEFVWVPRGG